jgi:hypothetical protein
MKWIYDLLIEPFVVIFQAVWELRAAAHQERKQASHPNKEVMKKMDEMWEQQDKVWAKFTEVFDELKKTT